MKAVFILCALVVAVTARPDGHYTDKYDNINLDEILANRKLLIPYIQCALEKGKCTADGKELKSHISESLENECAKCTETQRNGTRRVIAHLINNEPESWKLLSEKYDHSGKYAAKYEAELKTVA